MVINKHKLYTVAYLTGIYGYHAIDAEAVKCAAKTQIIIAVIFIPMQSGNQHKIIKHPHGHTGHERRKGLGRCK
jgi:hypothetical protein